MERSDNNGFLYFAVGALLVAIFVLGFFFFNGQNTDTADNLTVTERIIDTDRVDTPDVDVDVTPDFDLEVDRDGVRARGNTD